MDILLQWNSAPFTAGDAIPLSIQIKGAGLVIRAFLSRFEIPRPRPSSSQESVDSTVRKISHLIEHQGTLWHVTPFATVFLARIFKNSLAAATTNPVAHQAVDHIGELFAVLLESFRDAQTLEHADPLPKFSDLLTEDSLWPDDEEDDELRWEEEEVFSDSMFYSFWFYTKEVLADALNGLDEVPQEFAESISSLKELL